VAVARKVVWEQAEVEPAGEAYNLRVPVDGEHDPRWSEAFHRVVDDLMDQASKASGNRPASNAPTLYASSSLRRGGAIG